MTDLPPPSTSAELYLAAVHDRLGEILARLPEPQAPPAPRPPVPPPAEPGTVELREPVVPATPASTPPKRTPAVGKTGSGAQARRPARTPRKTSSKS